jgi:hypothetical protein
VKTLSDVQAATDAELLSFWNMHADGGRTFDSMISDRSKFEGWVMDLILELELEEAGERDEEEAKPAVNALQSMINHLNPEQYRKDVIKATTTVHKQKIAPTIRKAPEATDPEARSSNAAGVAKSWGDAAVKSARLARDGVNVTIDGKTTTHKSTREAFREYRLPDSKHIRFRLKLKASKNEMFEHEGLTYHFTIG